MEKATDTENDLVPKLPLPLPLPLQQQQLQQQQQLLLQPPPPLLLLQLQPQLSNVLAHDLQIFFQMFLNNVNNYIWE